jgi:hypothetical protein
MVWADLPKGIFAGVIGRTRLDGDKQVAVEELEGTHGLKTPYHR